MALGDWNWPVYSPKPGFTVLGYNELAVVFRLGMTGRGLQKTVHWHA